MRVGTGLYADYVGHRLARGLGVSGVVWQTGEPLVVNDYDALPTRDPGFPMGLLGSVVGIPLASGSTVMGVLGLASGEHPIAFGVRQVDVLRRFAELAALALDHAQLLESARHELESRTRAEEALRVSEERFRRLSDATSEALAVHREGVILEVNAAFCRLLGYEPEACIGRTIVDFAAPETVAAIRAGEFSSESQAPMTVMAMHQDGTAFPVEVSWRRIPYPDGEPAEVVSIRDLRERQRLEAELSRSALYDRMTGLPNRALLLDRVEHSLSWVRPDDDAPVAVVLLDVDRFKLINESLGHATGDRLLEGVARRLEACVRPGDTVARFGGDEFALLLDGIGAADEARRIAERVEAVLREPFDLDGREWSVSVSMGIAVGIVGLRTPASWSATRRWRCIGRRPAPRPARVYEPGMSAATAERLDLEVDLRRAVERDELRLHYQPLVALDTGRIVGLEALVRWQHPTRGLVPPLDFIPLAEETGLILSIGRWVLETACRQARAWGDMLPADQPLLMSVNLSARQFAQPDLAEQVDQILAETGLDPSRLELEITESVLMDESEAGVVALRDLRRLGVKLVLDDFGTGYSSLSYLKHLPLDTIKVDRSFVAGLDRGRREPADRRGGDRPGPWAADGRRRRGDRDRGTAAPAARAPLRPRPGLPVRPADARRGARRAAPLRPAVPPDVAAATGRGCAKPGPPGELIPAVRSRLRVARPRRPRVPGQTGSGLAAAQHSTIRSSRSNTTPSSSRAAAMKRSSISSRWPRPIASGCIVIVRTPPGSRSQA